MTYVIAEPCTDVKDRSCMEECPVDCIYEGGRSLYINPDECIDCGACEPACPVEAVYYHDDVPDQYLGAIDSSRAFFMEILPGRPAALGTPRGARKVGAVLADSSFVRALPTKK